MIKRYTLIFLFNNNMDKVLLMRGHNKLYVGKLNGFGGKIEAGETILEGAIRETKEETGLDINEYKHLLTLNYPENLLTGENGAELNILYGIHSEIEVEENREGSFEWYDVNFAMDFNNKEFAGNANIALFVREALLKENKITFYN